MLRRTQLLVSLLVLLLVAGSALAEEIWLIAGSEQQLTQTEARELILDGKYKMTKVIDGELTRAILYNSTAELTDYLPAEAIERMNRPPETVDPDAEWIGKTYPEFEFDSLDGPTIRSSDFAGKVVVLNYWFISCLPCVLEVPALTSLVQAYGEKDVSFVAVTFEPADKIRRFLTKRPFAYRQAIAERAQIQELGVGIYPTHVVLGRDGKVRAYLTGLAGGPRRLRKELAEEIDEALADS